MPARTTLVPTPAIINGSANARPKSVMPLNHFSYPESNAALRCSGSRRSNPSCCNGLDSAFNAAKMNGAVAGLAKRMSLGRAPPLRIRAASRPIDVIAIWPGEGASPGCILPLRISPTDLPADNSSYDRVCTPPGIAEIMPPYPRFNRSYAPVRCRMLVSHTDSTAPRSKPNRLKSASSS